MKTVVVFCAESKNQPHTRNVIRNLYKNSPVNVIYTGIGAKADNIKEIRLPLLAGAGNWNKIKFNGRLGDLLGARKVDLFIFEGCPLGFLPAFKNFNFNKNIASVIRKYSKNNTRIAAPQRFTPSNSPNKKYQIPSNMMVHNRNVTFPNNKTWGVYKFSHGT